MHKNAGDKNLLYERASLIQEVFLLRKLLELLQSFAKVCENRYLK